MSILLLLVSVISIHKTNVECLLLPGAVEGTGGQG